MHYAGALRCVTVCYADSLRWCVTMWVTICVMWYVTVRYGGALRSCVTMVRYAVGDDMRYAGALR